MDYYRILTNLSFKDTLIRRGAIQRLPLSQGKLAVLIERGAISRVETPDLRILPGWEERAKKLKPLGVITIEDFFIALDTDTEKLARVFEVDPADMLQWRQELERDWLTIP